MKYYLVFNSTNANYEVQEQMDRDGIIVAVVYGTHKYIEDAKLFKKALEEKELKP